MKNYRHYILLIVIAIILFFAIYSYFSNNKIQNGVGEEKMNNQEEILLTINDESYEVVLENNEATTELLKRLKYGIISVSAEDYGSFEKVGELGFSLPTSDTRITTKPGDIVLYQGDKICLYYKENTWEFTKLGHIKNITDEEVKNILGDKDIIYKLSLKGEENEK